LSFEIEQISVNWVLMSLHITQGDSKITYQSCPLSFTSKIFDLVLDKVIKKVLKVEHIHLNELA
jgi:hypothetical protein